MSNEHSENEKELWQRAKDFEGIPRAESYHELSKIAFEREDYPEALNMCLIAKDIFQTDQVIDRSSDILNLYQGIVQSYECLEEEIKAEEALVEAVNYAHEHRPTLEAELLRQLGRMQFGHKKYEASIESHTKAMSLNEISDGDHHVGIDYVNIGMCHHRLKNYTEAVRFEKIALEKFLEDDVEPHWLINVYGELTESYVELKMADEVLEYGQKALDWWEMEQSYQKCWTLKLYLAIAHRIKGELEPSLQLLKESRELALQHCNRPQSFLVDVDKEEGEILIMQGKIVAGKELLRRSSSVQLILSSSKSTG